ncbi:MAG: hypothetical protein PHY16_08115 [Methylobacter sp.]|nr:hypothetical protein [Methylobacter sp.]
MNFIKCSVFILSFTAFFISNAALAHDQIKSQALEGTTDDNAIKIGHACEASDKPVIAQSVVFPVDNPELSTSDGSTITNLSEVIEQGTLAGLVDGIQNRDIFLIQKEKYDALNNVTGFYGRAGRLATELQGRVPFAFTAPNFVTASCVKKLNIEVAIADICVLKRPTI